MRRRETFFASFRPVILAAAAGMMIAAAWPAVAQPRGPEEAEPPSAAAAGPPAAEAGAPAAEAEPAAPPQAAPPPATRVSAPAGDIQEPTDPVAKAAFAVLDKHCARCHQDGRLSARERPAKNFGNVLKLDEIAANPHYILPGNPFGSKLFKQIVDKEMPYDVQYEGAAGPEMTEADVKALQDWIVSLATKSAASCEGRKFVAHQDIVAMIASDLERQPKARRNGTRYFTLTHLKNACTDDIAMKVYRQAAIKLINSLSRSSTIVRLETIDPDETILRINIDDIGWTDADWNLVLASYPYNSQPDTELTAVLERSTGTRMPYVRADWFAYTASRPSGATPAGLYDKLLKLPNSFQALARENGVDVESNIKRFLAQRAGFQKSGVSRNNRLIERHPSRNGYFWTSYDFAGNRSVQSLFEHPLGPTGPNAFHHDGGETIFSLPNGFQAYYLNTAQGKPLATGPTIIVQDPSSKDLQVTNGISCMGCHDQGMRKAKDDIRAVVVAARTFPRDVREQVEGLYPTNEKMDQIISTDARRFADAMTQAGLDPALKLNGIEMITALAKHYESDMTLDIAAAELGLKKDEFTGRVGDASRKFRQLLRRLEQGSIPRDTFEVAFRELVPDMTDEVVVEVGGAPGAAGARPTGVSGDKTAAKEGDLSITSDKNAYAQGDKPTFTVVSSKDCFLTVTSLDEKGEGSVLFPNKFQQNNRIKAGVEVQLPGPNAPFQYRLKDKGFETVLAVCTDRGKDVDGIKHDFTRSAFTTVPNYTRSLTRQIVIEGPQKRAIGVEPVAQGGAGAAAPPAKPQAAGKPTKPASTLVTAEAGSRESFRSAIKIEVR